jgi:hypothetical protein
MTPLTEHAADESEQRLAELFENGEQPEVDPFRKRRILVRIERGEVRRPVFWLRPVLVAALLLSGTAAFALGRGFVVQSLRPHTEPAGALTAPAASPVVAVAPAPVVHGPAPAEPEAQAPAALAANEPTPPEAAAGSAKNAHRVSARARPGSEDPSDVVQAIQALRNDRDPSRAQTLLDDYLQTHPKGQLSEDALALSIEAASAKHDPRAADYARRYLSKFPHGRYRDVALRALAK